MSIRFIYGRSGSGKSRYCLQSMKKRIEDGKTRMLVLLVPEQFSFQAEKNIIEFVGDSGLLNIRVLSFKRMAEKVLDEVGGGINAHINDSGKNIVLYKVIEENRDKLKIFKKVSGRQGVVSNISSTIKELKKYNISPDDIKSSIERIENPGLRDKMEDMSIIFSAFQSKLNRNYIDDEDMLSILEKKLDKSSMFTGAEVWVDEFSTFTPQEYKILEKIMNKSYKVNFTLCMDLKDKELFLTTVETEQKLLEIAGENNISYEKPVMLNNKPCYKFKNNKELQHMEENLFSYPYKVYKSKPYNIKILKALNKYQEIENTARDIIRICREEGYRFKNIAVVTGDLDIYESMVKAVFSEYNIPYFIDKKRRIDDNPIVVLITSVVEILDRGWSYEAIFRYLKTGLLDIKREDIDILENYVLENGIRGSQWTVEDPWRFKISYSINEEKGGNLEEEVFQRINNIRNRVREPILELSKAIKGRKTGRERCRALYDFMCNVKIPEKAQQIISGFRENSQFDKANEYNQVWDIVVDILDQMVDTVGEDVFSLNTFNQVLLSGFQEYEIGAIPPSLDEVLVGSTDRIRSHDVKALYIIGVNDGIFPSSISYNGIFTDGDRDELRKRGMEIAESGREKAFQEQFLTYTTLTIMDRYLRLSYSMGDENGKSKRPSIIISRLKKLFPKLLEESSLVDMDDNGNIEEVSLAGATFNKLIENMSNYSHGNIMNSFWCDVYRWYHDHDEWNEKLNRVIQGFYYTNNAEILDTTRVRKLYGRHMNMSISRLEKFVQCPFSYFIQYGLKARQRKIYNLSPPDIGSFMHRILEMFSKKLDGENLDWRDVDKDWCSSSISDIINNELEQRSQSILNSSKRYRHMVSRLHKILETSVWLIVQHIKDSNFNPEGYEVSFGNSGGLPPISVKLHSGEEIELTGRVDRIDIMEKGNSTYLRIIDYKSGSKEFSISDLYYGLQIQLLVYLDVILEELSHRINKEVIPGGMLYFKMDDPIITGDYHSSPEEVERKVVKSFRMSGLILDDPDIIRDMDVNIDGTSDIVPASIKKDGKVSSWRSSVATSDQFDILRKYVRSIMSDLCERILEGDIEIAPCRDKDRKGCDFCLYSSICQFDVMIRGNRYNVFKKKAIEEVWQDIEKSIKH